LEEVNFVDWASTDRSGKNHKKLEQQATSYEDQGQKSENGTYENC